MKPAARASSMGVSIIRRVSDGAPKDAVPFGLGEPTWPMPETAARVLAASTGVCGYGPQAGRIELREALGRRHDAAPDDVLVTCGAQEALFAVCQAWLEEGDQALTPDPGFVGYESVIRLAGAEPVRYALDPDDRFRLDPARFRAALDAAPRAKIALFGHPANPTGAGATREALAEVARACAERGVIPVSDEVYRALHLGRRTPSFREVSKDGILLDSASKALASPGLRVGWIVAREELMRPIRVIHGFAVTTTAVPSQLAVAAMLDEEEAIAERGRAEVARRFEILADAFRRHLGRAIEPPDGGFYHFMALPESAHADPLAFCLRLRDEGRVVLVPGLAFGEAGRGFARLSFAARPELIEEGVRRYAAFVSGA